MGHDDFEHPAGPARVSRRGGSFITGALLSAAVSAGMALLYAPETGEKTRKRVGRRLGALQKEARRSRPAREAERQMRKLRMRLEERQRAEKRARLIAVLVAALAGAGLGMLLAPQSGKATRRRIGEGARRAGEAAAKLRGGAAGSATNGDWREPSRSVRSVQELGRDASDVF